MDKKVVLITDCSDVALLELRGTIYSNANQAEFTIEPIVEALNYNLINTAFLLLLIAESYPEGTIISVIMNPIKERTERIYGRLKKKNIIFEGTNTGVFGWLIKKYGCDEVYQIYDNGFVPFGGKFVHAPVIGRLLSGDSLDSLGTPFPVDSIRTLDVKNGTVLHVDNFGNIKFYGNLGDAQDGDQFILSVNEKNYLAMYHKRMMELNDGQLVIYPGSSFDLPEIGIVRGSASKLLQIIPGDCIEYRRKNDEQK